MSIKELRNQPSIECLLNKAKKKMMNEFNKEEFQKNKEIFEEVLNSETDKLFTLDFQEMCEWDNETMIYFANTKNFYSYADWSNTLRDIIPRTHCESMKYKKIMNNIYEEINKKEDVLIRDLTKKKNQEMRRCIIMTKAKYFRKMYLYINRNYYKMFSFSRYQLFKGFAIKSDEIIQCLNGHTDTDMDTDKYLRKVIQICDNYKFEHGEHGKMIGCVLNRLFCKDIALNIRGFI